MSVFEYTNYRMFLYDWSQRCVQKSTFSYRQFAKRAGFSSPNYLQRLIRSKSKINENTIDKLIKGLRLKPKEAEFFRLLVHFGQANNDESKNIFLTKLESLSKNSTIRRVQDENFRKRWYYPVVWELASCKNFCLNANNVVIALKHRISIKEAQTAIDFLIRKGHLVSSGQLDHYLQAQIQIESRDEVNNTSINQIHRHFSKMAQEALELEISAREFQGLTVAMSKQRFQQFKEKIKKIAQEVALDLKQA